MAMDAKTHPGPDRVDNVFASILQALSGVGDDDGQVRVLVEDLLYAAVVATRLPPRYLAPRLGGILLIAVDVAGLLLAERSLGWRLLAGGRGSVRCVVSGI